MSSRKVFVRASEAKEMLGVSDYAWRRLRKLLTPFVPPGMTRAYYRTEEIHKLNKPKNETTD